MWVVKAVKAGSELRGRSAASLPVLAIAVALVAWAAVFIFKASFVVDGARVFTLADDALISMTYARNLVEGHGFTWARFGDPVEGFTHPLWTLLMIPVHLALPLSLSSLAMSLLSLALLVVNLGAVHRLVRAHLAGERTCRTWPAVALTAAFYSLNFWALRGMETGLQALLVVTMAHLALDAARGRPRYLRLWLVATVAVLLRLDTAIACAVVAGFLVLGRAPIKGHRREFLVGLGIFAGVQLGYEAFRILYFGDVLPNTYYLKLHGIPLDVRWPRGAKMLARAAAPLVPALLALAAAAIAWRGTRRAMWFLLSLVVVHAAYSVHVGGDVWEDGILWNRFLTPAIPLLFACGNGAANQLESMIRARGLPAALRVAPSLAVALVLFAGANGLVLHPKAREHLRQLALGGPVFEVEAMRDKYLEMKALDRLVLPGARVGVTWAGLSAYFFDYEMVDVLGYNDRHIARGPMAARPSMFLPGHAKADYDYLMGTLRPDVIVQWLYRFGDIRVPGRRWGYVQSGRYMVRSGSPMLRPPR